MLFQAADLAEFVDFLSATIKLRAVHILQLPVLDRLSITGKLQRLDFFSFFFQAHSSVEAFVSNELSYMNDPKVFVRHRLEDLLTSGTTRRITSRNFRRRIAKKVSAIISQRTEHCKYDTSYAQYRPRTHSQLDSWAVPPVQYHDFSPSRYPWKHRTAVAPKLELPRVWLVICII